MAAGAEVNGTAVPTVTPAAGRSAPASLLACNRYESTCFCTIVRHPVWLAVGLTHASNVAPVVRSSDDASGTETRPVDPLNDNAPPKRPAVDHDTPPWNVPVLA